jgi:peptide/nickel transport system permease protein
MWYYVARRALQGLLIFFLVSFVVFSLVRLLPGDAIMMQLDQAAAPTPENLQKARQELGLDRPFLYQYYTWISGALHGDLGYSLTSRRPVLQELLKRISLTSHLAIMSLTIALLIALPVGVLSAVRQDTVADYLGRLLAILGLSLPDFWLATVVITFLAIWFRWIPPIGFAPIWVDPARNLSQLLLPALIIGVRLAAVSMRMTRSSLLEVLRQDYIRTAWAKGLQERVIIETAFKNAYQ